jgi:hypothetical protein
MITNLLLLLLCVLVAGAGYVAYRELKGAWITSFEYSHDFRAYQQETNRLLSRLIELETTKQQTRSSGRDQLRERIAERVEAAMKARAKG